MTLDNSDPDEYSWPGEPWADWSARKRALLQRLGGVVEAATVRHCGGLYSYDLPAEAGEEEWQWNAAEPWRQASEMLQWLPSLLAELDLNFDFEGASAPPAQLALPAFPGLTRLRLQPGEAHAAAADWLRQLPQLAWLGWHASSSNVPAALGDALASLTRLTALELRSEGSLPPGVVAAIAGLPHLRCLACEAQRTPAEVVGVAAGMPQLTALCLASLPGSAQLAQLAALQQLQRLALSVRQGADEQPWAAPLEAPAPAAFPALRSYRVACTRAGEGAAEGAQGDVVLQASCRRCWRCCLRAVECPLLP